MILCFQFSNLQPKVRRRKIKSVLPQVRRPIFLQSLAIQLNCAGSQFQIADSNRICPEWIFLLNVFVFIMIFLDWDRAVDRPSDLNQRVALNDHYPPGSSLSWSFFFLKHHRVFIWSDMKIWSVSEQPLKEGCKLEETLLRRAVCARFFAFFAIIYKSLAFRWRLTSLGACTIQITTAGELYSAPYPAFARKFAGHEVYDDVVSFFHHLVNAATSLGRIVSQDAALIVPSVVSSSYGRANRL